MQKAKIITFHNAQNYGAMLQAYALKETLKDLGLETSFVNYQDKNILADYKLIRTNSLKSFLSSIYFMPRNIKRKKSFRSFSDKYLNTKTDKCYTKDDVIKDINNVDIVIAGSDQIWNPNLTGGVSDIYTLNLNTQAKKIIYGASVGNEDILDIHKEEFKDKLAHLKHISVRENSIKTKLEKMVSKQVNTVLDPTLLLDLSKWNSLIEENNTDNLKSEEYILVYTLFESQEITNIANELSRKTGLKVAHFRKYNAYTNELKSLYTHGPVDFINAFKNAKYVVTNSFHGTVFSILFERNFFIVTPNTLSGRITDLLRMLNLETRIINGKANIDIDKAIDYVKVRQLLEKEKEYSINYLKKGITCQEKNN